MADRPILIGQNNPVSQQPGHQLYPYPPGCSGHRLHEMLRTRVPECGRRDYLDCFERRNLVTGAGWDKRLGVLEAQRISAELWGSGRVIVLLGQDVRRCFGHPELLLHPQIIDGCTWRQMPHPSGRNFWYNEPENVKLAALLLEELYVEYRRGIVTTERTN